MVSTRVCPTTRPSVTSADAESRIIPAPGRKGLPASVQLSGGVDSAHQVIVAARATNQTSDKQQAAAMMEETIDNVVQFPGIGHPPMLATTRQGSRRALCSGRGPVRRAGATRHGRVVPPRSHTQPSVSQGPDATEVTDQAGSAALRFADPVEPSAPGIPAVLLRGLEKVNELSLICTGHNLLKLFRFGVNLHRKARVHGPAQRIRNFAEVVSTALFAKLSGGWPGQPAQLVVAIHCR